jgi:MFS family permease
MSVPGSRPPLPRAILALFWVRLINSMGNFVFPFLTMLLTMKLGYSKTAAGAFMSTAALVAGLGVLVGGKIADTYGRKRTIVVLQLTSAGLLGICAVLGLVSIVPTLIAISYVMLQSSRPIFNALVADIAPPETRQRAYSLLYWGNNIGFSIGPIMDGYLFNAHTSYMFIGN